MRMVKSPRVARWCAALGRGLWQVVLECATVCCSVLQCDMVCCGFATVFCKISSGGALVCSTGTGLVEGSCSSVLQSAAVHCGVPHCVAKPWENDCGYVASHVPQKSHELQGSFAENPSAPGVQHLGKSHSYRVVKMHQLP